MITRDEEGNSTTSAISSDNNKLSDDGYNLAAFFLALVGILGTFNNVAVFAVMAKNKQLRSPMNLLLLNLACSDLGMCLVGTPVSFLAALSHEWHFGHFICVAYGFLMSLFGIASITTLTVLSFERYLMISKPLQTSKLTKNTSLLVMFGVWIYSTIITVPPLLGWGAFKEEGPGISCSVDWETRSLENTSYIIFMFFLGLGVPLGVMGFSYTNIVCTMRKSGNTAFQTIASKAEARVAVMVAVMGVTFLFAWTPYAVFALIMAFGDPSYITPGAATIPAIFAKSSCIYNPLIYVGLNTQFRSAWNKMFGCKEMDDGQKTMNAQTERFSITLCSDQAQAQDKISSKSTPTMRHSCKSSTVSLMQSPSLSASPRRQKTSFHLQKLSSGISSLLQKKKNHSGVTINECELQSFQARRNSIVEISKEGVVSTMVV